MTDTDDNGEGMIHDCIICTAQDDGHGPTGTATCVIRWLSESSGQLVDSPKCAAHATPAIKYLERKGIAYEIIRLAKESQSRGGTP